MRISDWSSDVCSSDLKTELVVTLTPTDAAGFARYAKAPRRSHRTMGPAPAEKTEGASAENAKPEAPASVPVLTSPIVSAPPPDRVSKPQGAIAARGRRPLVVIDAGHGGHDTGESGRAHV